MILVESLLVTLSFFSTLPVKILDWTNERIRFIPMMMGVVGLIIGSILMLFYFIDLEPMIMALLFIVSQFFANILSLPVSRGDIEVITTLLTYMS